MKNRSIWLRIFISLLAALTVLSAFCTAAFAEDGEEDENYEILEWENSLSLQNAIIHAKANPEKSYTLVIGKSAELDKTALLPTNLTLTFENCWFTIEEGGILRCYSGISLENAQIMVRGILEIDNYAFFSNSAIQVEDDGIFEGDADLYVLRMDDAEIDDFPIDGFDGIDYTAEKYDWGTCYVPIIETQPEETAIPTPSPEPKSEELRGNNGGLNSLRRWWNRLRFQLRRYGDDVIEILMIVLLAIFVPILNSMMRKGKTAKKKQPAAEIAEKAAREAAEWKNRAREAAMQRANMAAGAGRNSRPNPAGSAARRPDPRMKTFTKPEAPCIVCEHTGEDHFERDRRNRIKQLDEWLKNGLIDKAEYRALKQRYERDR